MLRWIAPAIVLLFAADAAAEPVIRPTVSGVVVFDRKEVAGGGSGSVALAYNLEYEPVLLMPEVSGTFGYYAGGFQGLYGRALAGFRGGAALSIEPTLFLRGGYGHNTLGPADAEQGEHGAAFQHGVTIDHRLSRDMTIGGELLYDVFIDTSDGNFAHTLSLGLTLAFWL